MCRRTACALPADAYFQMVSNFIPTPSEWKDKEKFLPSYNVSPKQFLPVIYADRGEQGVEFKIRSMQWGLKSSVGRTPPNLSNAKAETLTEHEDFAALLNSRRCVIIQDGLLYFYEWDQKTKKPFFIQSADRKSEFYTVEDEYMGNTLALAGLYDCVMDKATGEELFTFTILTTKAVPEFEAINDRLPVVLQSGREVIMWLDYGKFPFEKEEIQLLLNPTPKLHWHRVSELVNDESANSPELIKPVARDAEDQAKEALQPNPDQEKAKDLEMSKHTEAMMGMPVEKAIEELAKEQLKAGGGGGSETVVSEKEMPSVSSGIPTSAEFPVESPIPGVAAASGGSSSQSASAGEVPLAGAAGSPERATKRKVTVGSTSGGSDAGPSDEEAKHQTRSAKKARKATPKKAKAPNA